MSTFNLGNRILVTNPNANIDNRYGPHASVSDALIATAGLRDKGLTVGVLENGVVKEYWFKNGITDNDLILRLDVVITNPIKNQTILFNGTNFVNATPGTSFVFSINTFTSTIGAADSVIEMGTANSTYKAIGATTFSATYNNGTPSNGLISLSQWSSTLPIVSSTTNSEIIKYPSSVGNITFTLSSSISSENSNKTLKYSFYNRVYYGVSTIASGYASSDITSKTSVLSNTKARTITVTAGVDDYIIYAIPSRLGTPTMTVDGFPFAADNVQTLSITNASGFTENYDIWRSTNKNLGTTTIIAT